VTAPPPQWPRIGGPLDDVNDAFHDRYEHARGAAEHDAPVFVLCGDELVVFHRGRERAVGVTPRAFHALKSIAHAPIAAYVAAASARDRATFDGLARSVAAALASLAEDVSDASAATDARAVLTATQTFVADPADADAFARQIGPLLLRVTDRATAMQLRALHDAVEAALAPLTPGERRALQVVVVGDHQARERSLAMQYFRKRLREPAGAERRVAYAENAADAREALALVGTRRLDRAIARAFFGDDERLQRDVLGDAAERRLAEVELAPIE
jgi:hypothetical protein